MKTQNKVQLIGYLGIDPIITKLNDGSTKAKLRLATDRYRRDNAGTVQRLVTWHDVVAWDKTAENIGNNYMKGSHLLVEGEILHRTYQDQTGHTRYVSEVRASNIVDLDR